MFQYDPSVIPSIVSLEKARDEVQNLDMDAILADFRSLVLTSGQDNTFGLSLVHRHTDIPQGCRLMDLGQTLQTWEIPDEATSLHGASIRAKSLALREGDLWKPYEYEFGIADSVPVDFLTSVQLMLQQHKARHCLGLRRFSPRDPEELEVTDAGGISLKIPKHLVKTEEESTETFWAFPDGAMRKYTCGCRNPTGLTHFHIHGH